MFDIGFSEVLLIFVIALIVLGPEKLPRAASQVGRWVGRARAMARQFKEQLEEEVNLEQVRKTQKEAAAKEEASKEKGAAPGTGAGGVGVGSTGAATAEPGAQPPAELQAVGAPAAYPGPGPADFRADTFSHAHPTNEYGANPLTPNGGPPPDEPKLPTAKASATPASSVPSASETSGPAGHNGTMPSTEASAAQTEASAVSTDRGNGTQGYAPAATPNAAQTLNERTSLPEADLPAAGASGVGQPTAASEPAVAASQSDHHGHS
jgi:sec-independent protein translocase protein TatB